MATFVSLPMTVSADRHGESDTPPFTLGPILAETSVDARTHVLVVRPEESLAASRELERRVLELRAAGTTTIVVDVSGSGRISGGLLAALLRLQRRISSRNGRLVVSSTDAESRLVLGAAGLEAIEPSEVIPQGARRGRPARRR